MNKTKSIRTQVWDDIEPSGESQKAWETLQKMAEAERRERGLGACGPARKDPASKESDELLLSGLACFRHMNSLFRLLSSKTGKTKNIAVWSSSIADFAIEATISLIQAGVPMPITKNYLAGKGKRSGSQKGIEILHGSLEKREKKKAEDISAVKKIRSHHKTDGKNVSYTAACREYCDGSDGRGRMLRKRLGANGKKLTRPN